MPLPLLGYSDRLSVRPGETINFHVSNSTGTDVAAHLARVICADANPEAGGVRVEKVAGTGLKSVATAEAQNPKLGSLAVVKFPEKIAPLGSFTFVGKVLPTRAGAHQVIVNVTDADLHSGIQLSLVDGKLAVSWTGASTKSGAVNHVTEIQVPEREWSVVALVRDAVRGIIAVQVSPLASTQSAKSQVWKTDAAKNHTRVFYLALGGIPDGEKVCAFSGKLERPTLFDRALAGEEMAKAASGDDLPGLVACWDFSKEMHSNRIIDVGPHKLHGTLHNAPTRAVRGSTWTGREQCFRHAPDQYAAIHFHDDDIDDCRWPVTHSYTVPKDLKSGAYALMLEAGREKENLPFFVVPPKGKATAKLAVLVSTFTYTVYINHARPEWTTNPDWKAAWIKQSKEWGAYPHNPGQYPELGLSTYNHHTDGSGIAMASWHRPALNVRIGYLTYPYPDIRSSGLRHYPADSHLLAWLEHNNIEFDLITDWELHHEGIDLLKNYTCVMTGSHPEYHTGEMLDALEAYTHRGGRFMYMGGNGFYWKIALSPDKPGLIEIRRAEGGIRAWAAEPGEYYNQFDGEYGGLWRRNARPPQKLCGVGFTAQGNFVGSHYRVNAEARNNSRTAWMFDGVSDEIIGNFGFSGHGAAGFELDRTDVRLGSPTHAYVVAQSENHPPEAPWVLVPEEMLTHITTFPGKSQRELIRADMTLFETPNNGCVFSTGSITFCGSLPHNNFDNNISRLVQNVLTRFLDEKATFKVPG